LQKNEFLELFWMIFGGQWRCVG